MYVLAVLAVLGSVVTLWYYLVLQRYAFFGKLNEAWKGVKEGVGVLLTEGCTGM
jgi:NADH:ubiquinone oxidoreductase subunit 2 (subunit N)